MHHIYLCNLLILLCFLNNGPVPCIGNRVDDGKILNVGEELWKETLPLQGGSRLYKLQGLKSNTWYEVKISYPASIPASFALQLKIDESDIKLKGNRRLLNTEKMIFNTENIHSLTRQDGPYVLVTVEPEGVVAIPNIPERQFIIFNIVCDELLLGIPYKAWWVAALVILCLGIAFICPSFLPSYLLEKPHKSSPADSNSSKVS